MSFLSKWWFGNKAINNRVFPPKDTIPPKLYEAINWNKSAVAGSYALQQFTGDSNWTPSDVDIMVACSNKDEFIQEATVFEQKIGVKLVKSKWFDDIDEIDEMGPNTHDELFHERVIGSRTYKLEGFDKNIQLICLNNIVNINSRSGDNFRNMLAPTPQLFVFGQAISQSDKKLTPQEILSGTVDIPACVSYTMHGEQKIFHIPEKGREIILTGRGSRNDICTSRLEKYIKRGYEFYSDEME